MNEGDVHLSGDAVYIFYPDRGWVAVDPDSYVPPRRSAFIGWSAHGDDYLDDLLAMQAIDGTS